MQNGAQSFQIRTRGNLQSAKSMTTMMRKKSQAVGAAAENGGAKRSGGVA
jgi:hypothetical protein